jgi:ribonuclease HI
MRVFTDGSCLNNGRPNAKAGYAAWFPENPSWSEAHRVPDNEPQTNNRGELSAIRLAAEILERRGCLSDDIVIYSDSDYSINCLSKWLPGWIARGWKTADGKDVSNRDLIEDTTNRLARFRSHRFHHVAAHTGGKDDLSRQNAVVDRMARGTVEDLPPEAPAAVEDEVIPGCPLRIMGPPVRQTEILAWVREHLAELDASVVDKHLFKAFTEICKTRDIELTKQIAQRSSYIRAERKHLQITHGE